MAELYVARCPFWPPNVSHKPHNWLDESEAWDPKHSWCYGKAEPIEKRCATSGVVAHKPHTWFKLGSQWTEVFTCDGVHVLTALAESQAKDYPDYSQPIREDDAA